MQFARSGDAKPTQAWWHDGRQDARERAFNGDLSFFSDTERVKLDLDTAQIDGSDNPQTWRVNRAIDLLSTNGLDIRELRNR